MLKYAVNFVCPIELVAVDSITKHSISPISSIYISLASYKAYKLGMLSVFAAGNSGSGEDTHNPYAQIPWGMSVGAGTKQGDLIDFSSRGKSGEQGTFTMPDGSEWQYKNEWWS